MNKRKRPAKVLKKKFDIILNKAQEMGYKTIADAMLNPEFVEYTRSIKNKSYTLTPAFPEDED